MIIKDSTKVGFKIILLPKVPKGYTRWVPTKIGLFFSIIFCSQRINSIPRILIVIFLLQGKSSNHL